ncbi:MAG: dockerin type I domain-containing protein [Phycisphaerales bacterium]
MNTDEHRLTWVLVGAIGLCGGAAHAGGPPEYEVTAVIEGFQCGDHLAAVTAFALNDSGDVAGFVTCNLVQRAFRWTADTGLELVPMPPQTTQSWALAINGSKVVGYHVISGDKFGDLGFLYDFETDQFTSLGTLPGGNTSDAHAINSAGEIVGFWGDVVNGPFPQAFIWRDGEMIDIHPDFGTPRSRACDINANSQATGWMGQAPQTDARAFIWDDGKVTELPPIPGGFTSEGEAISNCGQVAGHGRKVDGEGLLLVRAFLWNKQEMLELGTLPGFIWSASLGMTPDGSQIVGQSWNMDGNPNIRRGFVWSDGVMRDLNDLIGPNGDLDMETAVGINHAGQIIARGHSNDLNATVGILLSPLQQSITGDLDNDGQVGASDLLILLSNWGPCEDCAACAADLDGNGVVGASDLLILLSNWG